MGLESKSNKKNKKRSQSSKDRNTNSNSIANTTATISANSNPRKSRRRSNRRMSMTPVQMLFETCKEVFSSGGPGIVPPPESIRKLREVLDDFNPGDVGLTPSMPYFQSADGVPNPTITYLHLYECDQFSIGIFCLPKSGVLPLHNHPGMTVFSKLLFGTLHIKSYDWVAGVPSMSAATNSSEGNHPEVRLAKLKVDSDFTAPCNTSILYPSDGGNLHCFTAMTQCAVLDVLGPPYSDSDGRHCTYYYDFPYANFSVDDVPVTEEEREGCAWLQEREKPEDLAVVGALYTGPQIVDQ